MTNTMISVGTVRVLPRPAAAVMSLTDALASRRSVRDYAETPVTDEKLAYILWAAAGITAEDGSRTVPSTMHKAAIASYSDRLKAAALPSWHSAPSLEAPIDDERLPWCR